MQTNKALNAFKRATFYSEKATHFYTLAKQAVEASSSTTPKTTTKKTRSKVTTVSTKRGRQKNFD